MGPVVSKNEPVRGIRQWRDGAPMWLYEGKEPRSSTRVLCLGKAPDCDLQAIPDPTIKDAPEIGDVHCTLVCTVDRVTVSGIAAVGPTWVNDIHVLSGEVEVRPGNVITVGSAQLVVFGDDPRQPPDITAPDISTLIAKTKELFEGGTSKKVAGKVADALGVPRTTFQGWVKAGKFGLAAAAVVCLAAGGWLWQQPARSGQSGKQSAASTADLPRPTAGMARTQTPPGSVSKRAAEVMDEPLAASLPTTQMDPEWPRAQPASSITRPDAESLNAASKLTAEHEASIEHENRGRRHRQRLDASRAKRKRPPRPAKTNEPAISNDRPATNESRPGEIYIPFRFGGDVYSRPKGD